MTKKCVLYARKSPTIDKSIQDGIDAQLQDCEAYALKNGYEVVEKFADTNASGDLLDLPELNTMLELCSQGIDFVIVRELDRLARDSFKFASIKRELLDYGTKIKFVLQDFDDSEEGQLQEDILAAIASYEKKKLARRVKRGRQQKLQNGNVMLGNGSRPYGYEPVIINGIKTLAIVESEAETIRMIFNDYINGLSYRQIAEKLAELAIPTMSDIQANTGKRFNKKKRGYAQWDKAIIGKIINNRVYIGEWQYGKIRKTKKGTRKKYTDKNEYPIVKIPAIITKSVYDAAQQAKVTNTANQKRRTKHEYLLAKRVTCDHCQSAMTANSSPYKSKSGKTIVYTYYKCHASMPNRRPFLCDHKQAYKTSTVDDIAWEFIINLFSSPDNLNQRLLDIYNNVQDNKPITRLEKHVQNAEKFIVEKETELGNLIDTMILMPTEETKKRVATQVKQCEQELKKLRDKHTELLAELTNLKTTQLTLPKIKNIVDMAKEVSYELTKFDDFKDRRQLVIDLDVKAKLFYSNGKKQVEVSCIIPEMAEKFCLDEMSSYKHLRYTQNFRLTATFVITRTGYIEV